MVIGRHPRQFAAAMLLIATPYVNRARSESLQADEIVSAHVRSLMVGHITDVVIDRSAYGQTLVQRKIGIFAPWVHDLAESNSP